MQNLINRITSLKESVKESESELSRLQGRREALYEELKTFGVDSKEQCQEKIEEIKEAVNKKRSSLEEVIEKLEVALNG